MSDDALKSAYELAMEKLRARDGEPSEPAHLSEDQKAEIADIRQEFRAKRAEIELGYKGEMANARRASDLQKVEELEREYRSELERLSEREEERVRRVREGA